MRRILQQVYKTQSPMENSSLDKFSGWRWPLWTADAMTNCQRTLPYNSIGI